MKKKIEKKIIKNYNDLNKSKLRKIALDLITEGIKSVKPENLMRKKIKYENETLTVNKKTFSLKKKRIFIIGAGKATSEMAEALEKIIPPNKITAGIVNVKKKSQTKKIKSVKAGHPKPNKQSMIGTKKILSLKKKYSIGKEDVVICLLSGGGSSMLTLPANNISLQSIKKTTNIFLKSGATISEINTVRKHLSEVKGGKLSKHFSPATIISIIISDVAENDLSTIASGPTTEDKTTFSDAIRIIKKYGLENKLPKKVLSQLTKAPNSNETPKDLKNNFNLIIGDNKTSLKSMKKTAKKKGFKPIIYEKTIKGETKKASREFLDFAHNKNNKDYNLFLAGGETTPKIIKKAGTGGRNQHFVAESSQLIKGSGDNFVLASINTDGNDFIKKAAGAIIDNSTLFTIRRNKINVKKYLEEFNTYNLFLKIKNSIVKTGNTKTNVGDFMIYIRE